MVEVQHAPVVADGRRNSDSSSGQTSPLRRAPSEPYTGQLADIANLLKLDVLQKLQRQVSGLEEFLDGRQRPPPHRISCVQRARCAPAPFRADLLSPPSFILLVPVRQKVGQKRRNSET